MVQSRLTGPLHKMRVKLSHPIAYSMVFGEQVLPINDCIGQPLQLTFTGEIHCIQCGRAIKRSFQQGFCFPCFRRLQSCQLCIIHPERCLVEQGQCPENDWAHGQCNQQHVVYLANASGLKVGVTRLSQVPTRWIDQGAVQALAIWQLPNRYRAGLLEVLLKKILSDKTDWRKMLRKDVVERRLTEERKRVLAEANQLCAEDQLAQETLQMAQLIEPVAPITLMYPLSDSPPILKALSFDHNPVVSGRLLGIKGQYLILDTGVLNVRKFGGYVVECVAISCH